MGPNSGNRRGQNRRPFLQRNLVWGLLAVSLGFVQKSRSIKPLARIQAQNWCRRPDLRLNGVLLPRTPPGASRYRAAWGYFEPAFGSLAAADAWRSRAASSSALILAWSAGAI